METNVEVRRRTVKPNDEENQRKDEYTTGSYESSTENTYPSQKKYLTREYEDEISDFNSNEDIYSQFYFQGYMDEPLFKSDIDPILAETHITSRGAIVLLLVVALLLLCFSFVGLLEALAYKGAREQPVASSSDDFYHLYGPFGKWANNVQLGLLYFFICSSFCFCDWSNSQFNFVIENVLSIA